MSTPQYQFPYVVDQGATPPGTDLQASYENCLTFAQTMLLSGGIPTPGGGLPLVQPATSVIYNDGTGVLSVVQAPSQTLTMIASQDNYVELTADGTYQINHVTNGNPRPALLSGSIIQLDLLPRCQRQDGFIRAR